MNPPRDSTLQRIARLGLVLAAIIIPGTSWSEQLPGTVIAVEGDIITVETEIIEGLSPAPGNPVDVIIVSDDGANAMPAGTWRVTSVQGAMVTAEKTDRVYQPAMVGMQAVIHVAEETGGSGEPTDVVPGDNASTPRGMVTMLRGDMVTIELDPAASSLVPQAGDELQLLYTVAGEPLVVGTWRVTAVGADDTVEAEPVELIQPPSIGYQAVFLPKKTKPGTPVVSTPSPDAKDPVESTPASAAPRATLGAGRSETDVTRGFADLERKTSCDTGTVSWDGERLEMSSKVGDPEEHCVMPITTESLESFRVSADLRIDSKDFLVGFVLDEPVNPDSGRLTAYLATMTLRSRAGSRGRWDENWTAWLGMGSTDEAGHDSAGWLENTWRGNTEERQNPGPGTLEWVKDGPRCSLSWNGEHIFSWEESRVQRGIVKLMFKQMSGRRGEATFSNVSVKRLD